MVISPKGFPMHSDSPIKYNPDRVLSQAQKDINPDPRYWDWFDAWWEQDFSWGEKKENGESTGLARHVIEGSDQTLQDYWREEETGNRLISFAERRWTRFHLPPHNQSGREKNFKSIFQREQWNTDWWEDWQNVFFQKLQSAREYDFNGPDTRAQLTGIIYPGFGRIIPNASRDVLNIIYIRSDWTHYGNHTLFNNVCFGGITKFTDACFGNDVFFNNTQYLGEADFNYSLFGKNAQFDNVVFDGTTYFSGAVFGSYTRFRKSVFNQGTSFNDVHFGYNTNFSEALFMKYVHFNMTPHFTGSTNSKRQGSFNFIKTIFFGRVSFHNRVFQPNTDFTKAEFHKLAEFHGGTFHQDTSFSGTGFKVPGKGIGLFEDFWLSFLGYELKKTEPYQRAFRTLRQLMEKNGAFSEAYKFGRYEQIAKERRITPFTWPWNNKEKLETDVPFWERQASRAYGLLADYGQNALRPFLWLSATWLFASIGYSAIAQIDYPIVNSFGDAASVAFQYSLPPVSTFAAQFFDGDVDQTFKNALLDHPFWTRFVMVSHGVLSLALVFFLLLALKRRFQIR
jgi:Pentapeptide repeats (9 copies)